MSRDSILEAFSRLRRRTGGHESQKEKAQHKPLLVLYALGQWRHGKDHLSFSESAGDLDSLLQDFGAGRGPEFPFWRLQNDRIWEVTWNGPAGAKQPSRRELVDGDCRGGFSDDVLAALRSDPSLAAELTASMLGSFPTEQHGAIRQRVGLSNSRCLVDLIRQETGADFEQIVLLRHFNRIGRLLELGGSIEEFTFLQPKDTKWDFWRDGTPQIHVIAVIVHDQLFGVFRVRGIEAEGTFDSLASTPLRRFDEERNVYKPDQPTRRFTFKRIPSMATDATITGWQGREINPIVRSDATLFREIEVNLPDGVRITEEIVAPEMLHEGALYRVIVNAYERNSVARDRCIAHYGRKCVICGFDFGAVYGPIAEKLIHVHHVKPLSEIGEDYKIDPIADLRPVCPNCHAVIHHGGRCRSVEEVRQLLAQASAPNRHCT